MDKTNKQTNPNTSLDSSNVVPLNDMEGKEKKLRGR